MRDDEWAFAAAYLTLMREDAPQRDYSLGEVFNGLRWIMRSGAPWRMMPNALPPWDTVYPPGHRWLKAGVFEALVQALRGWLRLGQGRQAQPSAAILDSRTLQSSPESGGQAAYEGAKGRKGSKLHMAVDTLGKLLAAHVTPANEQDRAQLDQLARAVQEATGHTVQLAFVDQGYTGDTVEQAAAQQGIALIRVKLPEAQKGFVLLPRRWVIERSNAWMAPFRRLARDYERLPDTLTGLHFLAFAILMLAHFVHLLAATSESITGASGEGWRAQRNGVR